MSITAGYFDETISNDIRVLAERIMFDDRIKQQFIPQYDVINAIKAVQTANVMPIAAKKRKKVDVEVEWENFCGIEVEDNTTCEIGGTKTSTNLEEYALSYEKAVNFSVDEADFLDNDFDIMGINTTVAKAMLVADKQHTEAFAQYCVAQINTFKGMNQHTTGKGTVVGTDTYILPEYWDATLMAYMNLAGIKNRFTTPSILTGENLYESVWVANANKGNADGKGDPMMWGSMPINFDLFNVDTVNDPDKITYMLSQGSLAFGNRWLNPDAKEHTIPFDRSTMQSRFLPFKYDVFVSTECTTDDLIRFNFKIKLQADLFNNPQGCEQLNTGVLTFICGESS